jgi:hypothetical protein
MISVVWRDSTARAPAETRKPAIQRTPKKKKPAAQLSRNFDAQKKQTAGSVSSAGGTDAAPIAIGACNDRSVDAGAGLQSRNLILYLQLATLQLCHLEMIRRGVLESLGDFVVKRPVTLLEFGELRRCGHVCGLLASIISLTTKF